MLDLDGTLMPSHEVDNRCYWQAVSQVLGRTTGTLELGGFAVVTDNGILDEWCRGELGRPPGVEETRAVRERFLALIEAAAASEPDSFRPLPGLRRWLQTGLARGRGIAVATGGWGHTARYKLQAAGLADLPMPLASADDAPHRVGIMQAALASLQAAGRGGGQPVYIGDGPWDVAAASELGWAFIGIASGRRAAALRAAGASQVLPDFRAMP